MSYFSKSFSGFVSPKAAAIGVGASVLTPAFLRNDNRGYISTALVTTPLIAAGTVTASELMRVARENANKVVRFSNRAVNPISAAPGYEDIVRMRNEVASGGMFSSEFQRQNLSFLNDYSREPRDILREGKAMRSQLRKLVKDKSYTTLLSNAIQAEEYRTMSAAELASRGEKHVFGDLSLSEGASKLRRLSRNPEFVRGFNYRLQAMRDFVDQGGSIKPVMSDFGPGTAEGLLERSFNWRRADVRRKFSKEFGNVYEHIQSVASSGFIDDIKLMTLNEPGSKSIRHFTGVSFRRGKDRLNVRLVQPDSSIFMQGGRKGVSRKIAAPGFGVMEADIFAFRNMDRDFSEIRSELNRAQFGGFTDPASEGFNLLDEGAGYHYRLDPLTIKARNKQVVLSNLTGFSEGRGFNSLSPREQEEAILEMNKKYGLIKAWGDSNISRGILETGDISDLYLGGVINTEKTGRMLRGTGKPIVASSSMESVQIAASRGPFSGTNAISNMLPGTTVPEFGARVGAVSPHLKSLVSDLPTNINANTLAQYADKAMGYISKDLSDNGVSASRQKVQQMWANMAKFLENDKNARAVRRLGYLGEGTHLLLRHSGEEGLPFGTTARTLYVHDLRLSDIESMVRDRKEFGSNLLLGFRDANPVTARGSRNVIQGYRKMDDGTLGIDIVEATDIASAKLDGQVKGLAIGLSSDPNLRKTEASRIRRFMNMYGRETGTGYGIMEDTDILTLQHYAQNKAPITESVVNIAADTMRRLETSGELSSISNWSNDLERLGYAYDVGRLTQDSSMFVGKAENARRALNRGTVEIIRQMMDDVGARVKAGQIQGDSLMRKYLAQGGDMSLMDFMFRQSAPVNVMITDSVEQNVVQEAAITYDMLGRLEMNGYSGTLKELKNRARVDGDLLGTQRAMEYINQGDFSSPLGPGLSVSEAFPRLDIGEEGKIRGLSSAQFRAGTVFDPAHEIAKDNWSLRLSDNSYVPVLGHEVYGGKINQYSSGEFSTNARESLLADLVVADKAGEVNAVNQAREAYMSEIRRFGYGKESFLRPRRVDPLGIAGRIHTRPSSIAGNPFEIGISSNLVERIRNKQIRDMLIRKQGEDVFAVVARHPVSSMPFMRVVEDSSLPANTIGMDEGARGLIMADNDGDILNAFFLKPGNHAYNEAKNAVYGGQGFELGIQRAFEGLADDSRLTNEGALKSLSERAKSFFEDDAAAIKELGLPEIEALRRRPAGGSVGRFSNVLTEIGLGLEHNSRIVDPKQKAILQRAFWPIRQASITAQKKSSSYTLDKALRLASDLSEGLRDPNGFERFYGAMTQVSRDFGKEIPYNSYMGSILGIPESAAREVSGQKVINPFLEFIKDRSLLQAYHSGIDHSKVKAAARALTATEDTVASFSGSMLARSDDMLTYLFPHAPSNKASDMAAASLGAMNEATRNVTGEIREIFGNKIVRRSLGVGLGVAALAGILNTSFGAKADFSKRRSANAARPEEMLGDDGYIPGEPVSGSMSSNPPRRIAPVSARTNTAVVAPVRQAVDLEVKAKSIDSSVLKERAKLMARMATDGDSNVTINYGSRPKNSTLRMRDKVRDIREEA